MGDSVPGGHQVELPGRDELMTAQAVAVLDEAVRQPGDGLQAGVRVRRHLHARAAGDVVRAEVVDEAPGPDQSPLPVRQQPPDRRVPAQRHVVSGQQYAVGLGHVGHGGGVQRLFSGHHPTL
jgi:hypothetical protein